MRSLRAIGWFVLIIGTAAPNRLIGSALSLDQNFHPPAFRTSVYAGGVAILPSGKIVLYRNYETLKQESTGPITRYFADGTLDQSFNFGSDFYFVNAVAPFDVDKLIVSAAQSIYQQPYANVGEIVRPIIVRRILRVNEDGSVDPSFNSGAKTTGLVQVIVVQQDSKILVAGSFTDFAGASRQGIVRLLADGTVDPDFAAVTLQSPSSEVIPRIWTLAIVPTDGKIIIGGTFSGVNGVDYPGIARLNPDGTLDPSFQPSGFGGGSSTRGIVLQNDHKILIGGLFTLSSHPNSTLVPVIRLDLDGTADQSYGCFTCFSNLNFFLINSLAIQIDDKVIAAGNSVYRFNTDGSIDDSFQQPELIERGLYQGPSAASVQLDTDGRIVVAGTFSNVKNAGDAGPVGEHFSLARLNSDGTVDTTFVTHDETAEKEAPIAFRLERNGFTKVVFGLSLFPPYDPVIPHNVGRLGPDGSIDTTFDPLGLVDPESLGSNFLAEKAAFLPNGALFLTGINEFGSEMQGVLLPDGSLVPNYEPYAYDFTDVTPYGSTVLIGNPGERFQFSVELQRLNGDGSIDTSFYLDPQIAHDAFEFDSSSHIVSAAIGSSIVGVLQDGKILFSYLAADHTYRLVRLNADGSIDSSFQAGAVPVPSQVTTVVNIAPCYPNIPCEIDARPGVTAPYAPFQDAQELASGQVIVVGEFDGYGSSTANGIVRLNHDGSVDGNFRPGSGAEWTQTAETAIAHPAIDNIELSTDAKLLITGTFEAFNGMPAPGIASLNLDGSPDLTFVAPVVREKFDIRQAKLQRQSDGSYLLSGPYSVPGQSPAPSFVHLNNATKFRTEALVRHGLNVVATFDAAAGNTYRLEYKNALTDDTWTRVPGVADLTASKTGLARLTDPGAASVSQRFYRVRLVP